MFAVKIDLWPHGRVDRAENLQTILACNDGTSSDHTSGNYRAVALGPAGERSDGLLLKEAWNDLTGLGKPSGLDVVRVFDFPRNNDQTHLASLTIAILRALGLDEVYTEWSRWYR